MYSVSTPTRFALYIGRDTNRGIARQTGMRYRVVFRERFDVRGDQADEPPEFLDPQLTDDILLDAQFIERTKPDSLHVQEVMDEDDSWVSIGTEVWEYEVADDRESDFIAALENSRMVVEYERLDETPDAL